MTLKSMCQCSLFLIVAIAIVIAGTALGIMVALITPILIVFTGLWIWKFINRDYPASDFGSED